MLLRPAGGGRSPLKIAKARGYTEFCIVNNFLIFQRANRKKNMDLINIFSND